MYRLYKSPSDQIINQGPACAYTCKKITYETKRGAEGEGGGGGGACVCVFVCVCVLSLIHI